MPVTLEKIDQKIDQLTEIMLAGFDKIDKRFEQVDARFEQVDARFEQVDARFEQVDARFDEVDRKFREHDKKFDQLFFEIKDIKAKLEQLSKRTDEDDIALFKDMEKLKKRVIFLEKEVARLSMAK